jgi:hypothetical protein
MPAERRARRKPLPNSKKSEPVTREQPSTLETPQLFPTVIYAGKSQRRLEFLKYLFGSSVNVIGINGGPEDETKTATQIAKAKVEFAARQIPGMIEAGDDEEIKVQEPVLMIGADVRASVLGMNEDGTLTVTKCLPRPKRIEDVQTVFKEMSEASELTGINPYYSLTIGTDVDIYNAIKASRIADHVTTIELNLEKVKEFSTEEGFNKYCLETETVINHPSYLPNGDNSQSVLGIAGGLDLITLLRLGAVQKITLSNNRQCLSDDPRFPQFAKKAIFDATISILHKTLKPQFKNIDRLVDSWKPLQDYVDLALNRGGVIFQE